MQAEHGDGNSAEEQLMKLVRGREVSAGAIKQFLKANEKVNVNYSNELGMTPLLCAVGSGEVNVLQLLIAKGAQVNKQGKVDWNHPYGILDDGDFTTVWPPLLYAATFENPGVIKVLVRNGANINFRDTHGRSALSTAISHGRPKSVEALVALGAEMSDDEEAMASLFCPAVERQANAKRKKGVRNKRRGPALHIAASRRDVAALQETVAKGVDINQTNKFGETALSIAVTEGFIECVDLLLKMGANTRYEDEWGRSLIHVATLKEHNEIINMLCEHGMCVNARDNYGYTPLFLAAARCYCHTVVTLIKCGADVNAELADATTALHLAAENLCDTCTRALMLGGANMFLRNKAGLCPLAYIGGISLELFQCLMTTTVHTFGPDGTTAQHVAAYTPNIECLTSMLESECDVNVRTRRGDTPLIYASSLISSRCQKEASTHMALLIQKGALVYEPNAKGLAPIHVCAMKGNKRGLKLLLKSGVSVDDICYKKQRTPLHYAAESGLVTCLKFLTEKGADINAQDSGGRTALKLAAKNANFACVRYLLQQGALLKPPRAIPQKSACLLKAIRRQRWEKSTCEQRQGTQSDSEENKSSASSSSPRASVSEDPDVTNLKEIMENNHVTENEEFVELKTVRNQIPTCEQAKTEMVPEEEDTP